MQKHDSMFMGLPIVEEHPEHEDFKKDPMLMMRTIKSYGGVTVSSYEGEKHTVFPINRKAYLLDGSSGGRKPEITFDKALLEPMFALKLLEEDTCSMEFREIYYRCNY